MNKIAIILTTFARDILLYQTLKSIEAYYIPNSIVLIGDQGTITQDKIKVYQNYQNKLNYRISSLPFDCGLSYARNYLVQQAKMLDCEYCLITADSLQFIEQCNIDTYVSFLNSDSNFGIVGFNIKNRQAWEGEIDLIPNLCFSVQQLHMQNAQFINYNNVNFYNCTVVRNFFLAKTQCLLDNSWDNELKLCEHEDFFWRLKQTKWKVFYTDSWASNYVKMEHNQEYSAFRQRMYTDFKQVLLKKYNISTWLKYKR